MRLSIKKMPIRLKFSAAAETFVSSVVGTALFIGIVIFVNLLGMQYFLRADLTADQVFTLSEGSRDIVRNLDDKLIAKAYFTDASKLSAPYDGNRRILEDKLAEYATYAGGNFSYEFIDPADDAEREQEAVNYGVQPIQFNVVKSDQYSVQSGFMGVVFIYGDKHQTLPAVVNTDGLEYDISSALTTLLRDEPIVVGFLQDELAIMNPMEKMRNVYTQLGQAYEVQTITPSELPGEIDVLIVAGIEETLSDYAVYQIDQALMHGVSVLALPDVINVNLEQGFAPTPLDTGLNEALASYGIGFDRVLVLDEQNEVIPISTQQGAVRYVNQVPYPFMPSVTNFGDSVVGRNLQQVAFSYVSSLTQLPSDKLTGTFTELARTSDRSWSVANAYDISPMTARTIAEPKGSFPVAMSYAGPLTSHFSGQTAPAAPATDSGSTPTLESGSERLEQTEQGRLIVIGTSKFIQDSYLLREANIGFFLNSIDWLAQNEGLISIRSKTLNPEPLREVDDSTRVATKWFLILGLPVLVGLAGVIRFRRRRSQMKRIYKAN